MLCKVKTAYLITKESNAHAGKSMMLLTRMNRKIVLINDTGVSRNAFLFIVVISVAIASLQYAQQIIIKGNHHQHTQNDHPDLLTHMLNPF